MDCTSLDATVPPVTLIWYQRGTFEPDVVRRTVCEFHNDSAPPMLVYWFCIIARMPSESSAFFGVGLVGGFALAQLLEAVGWPTSVNVDSDGRFQSTLNA